MLNAVATLLACSASAFAPLRTAWRPVLRGTVARMELPTDAPVAAPVAVDVPVALEADAAAVDGSESIRLRTVCVALIGQYGKIEDILEAGELERELDFDGFTSLVDTLEVQCSAEDARAIFDLIDTDGSRTIDASELKAALRSSGAITSMYDDSLRTFGLLLAATLGFDALIFFTSGGTAAFDFLTAYFVEDSLSVDNLFVFLMLFEYFHVPDEYTERVLRWGIISALVLRGFMIAMGVAAVEQFRPVLLVFALILIVSAYKMMQPENEEDLSDNAVMRIARWLVDATDEYDGDKFFTTVGGVRRATPMLVVLICIELSDVLFAVDSIPAVVGITHDPFIVYTSNIFALMALRSLYLILAKSVQQLLYLRHAVAAILGFVGVKMVAEFFDVHVSSLLSLGIICALLAAGTAASIIHNRSASTEAGGPSHHGKAMEDAV